MTDIVVTGPDGSTFHFPQGTAADTITSAMQSHYGQAKPQTVYSGSILPLSKDSQGNVHFDSNAGIMGLVKHALMLPGDVSSGKTPIVGPNGHTNPEVIDRAADLAGLISPANPAARAGDLAIAGETSYPLRQNPPVPSAQTLKDSGVAAINAAKNSDLVLRSGAVGDLSRRIQQELFDVHHVHPLQAEQTFKILNELENAPAGSTFTASNLQTLREILGNTAQNFNPASAKDQLAASVAIKRLDDLLPSVNAQDVVAGTPADTAALFTRGRGDYASAMRSADLTEGLGRAKTGLLERAEGRAQSANSGRNIDNAIRGRAESLLEKPKEVSGFSDPELNALENVVQGSRTRNAARYIGNLLGGGGGFGQAFVGGLGAAGSAYMGASPTIVGATAFAPAFAGATAKTIANILAKRSLRAADKLVRSNSPLYQELLRKSPLVPDNLAHRAAMARAILMGTLANGNGKGGPTIFFPQSEQ